MRYDFLKHFPKRMKHVGLYAVLLQGSLQKTTWQKYGFVRADEQINLIFAVHNGTVVSEPDGTAY